MGMIGAMSDNQNPPKGTVMRKRWASIGLLLATPTLAQDNSLDNLTWPRQMVTSDATIILYQPQPESFEGNRLTARAAVTVTPTAESEPLFGAVWIEARVATDRDARTVDLLDAKVTRTRFPGAEDDQGTQVAALLEQEIPTWHVSISLDDLIATLAITDKTAEQAKNLKFEAPKIVVTTTPSVLVTMDGEPVLRPIDGAGAGFMRVSNTPFLMVLDPATKKYYLDGGSKWYAASEPKGPYRVTEYVPTTVLAQRPKETEEEAEARTTDDDVEPEPATNRIPEIVVATVPTELVVIDGAPDYAPIGAGELLYVKNTQSDVLIEIGTQRHFLLISGRWYAAPSVKGPWKNIPSDQLPASFAKIPEESDKGHLLVFIAGTDAARDAVIDTQIPQTATIKRDATISVSYDGDPDFEDVEGTEMDYAVNTTSSVLMVNGKYYCCDQATWYVSNSPTGPWVVVVEVPSVIYTIPPSCPVYNVRFVRVYGYTGDVVYVGYTPGYMGSYVYGSTIVYGTGYAYNPWIGSYYVPRPATWGFHVHWNPWTGWRFGLSYSTGAFTFGVGFGRWGGGRWWGPAGWHGGLWHGWHHGFRHGAWHGWHRGYRSGARAGYRAGRRSSAKSNAYRNHPGRGPEPRKQPQRPTQSARERPNNQFADRSGNVHRNQNGSWQSRDSGSWRTNSSMGSSTRNQLNRSSSSRQRGNARTQNSPGRRRR